MMYIDANAILRYTLNDNKDMAVKVGELLAETKVCVRYEVWAEVVYVLSKVYSLPRGELVNGIGVFLSQPNVITNEPAVLSFALKAYADTGLDFVDCILLGLKAVGGHDVFTFDKKLASMINNIK